MEVGDVALVYNDVIIVRAPSLLDLVAKLALWGIAIHFIQMFW
jgi:hypothetical protein